jgi:hypothetical protein
VMPAESDQKTPSKFLISVSQLEPIHNAHGTGSPVTAARRTESHRRAWGAKYLIVMNIAYPIAPHIIYLAQTQADHESDIA